MSHNSSPGHTSPNSFYDPSFTAEMTSKMRVPDKICVVGGAEPPDLILPQHSEMKSRMNVPERIIVAGDNKHIAVRESVPELKFDTPFPNYLPNLVLAPPPNVLTVDEYPAEVSKPQKPETRKEYDTNKDDVGLGDLQDTSLSIYAADDDLTKLRVQLRHLSRRVLAIEQENQQRQQREIVMYAIGVTYILMKSLLWIHRHL
ncbi:mitochondrial fission factor [Parasteatoda tepidariorum]|uniref:mitochondrial fission factor n=1 Tax=Parasteatoda tepidariorum TaxID=114398 RepID=UPI00077F896C|nr:mitochondrial fission factor [Parasteatoda tepidariorum]